MQLCDTNVWLALVLSKHVHHAAVVDWLNTVDPPASIFFCRATQNAFLRLLTNAAVLAPYGIPARTNREAWEILEGLLADDRIALQVTEPQGVEALWKKFASRGTASPKLWMDAYLAAFARAGRYRMVTTDAGFRQFQGLEVLLLGRDHPQST